MGNNKQQPKTLRSLNLTLTPMVETDDNNHPES